VATARDASKLEGLKAGRDGQLLCLTLDVTSDAQADAAVKAAVKQWGGVDVLVNNAGYGYFATQEEHDLAEVRAMFETNVFGLARMTSKLLPLLRKKGGAVVNLSSIGGRMATPRGGFYQATKWAVEAISESLYFEACSFGVRVIVIEPGAYDTDFSPRSAHSSPRLKDEASPYFPLYEKWTEMGGKIFVPRQDPAEVVEAIVSAVRSGEPFVRLPVGRDATDLVSNREKRTSAEYMKYMHQRAGYGKG
jgi:NAD(P)-dependent dehydrogenase (short-subunit alcohol dehydrogenase family)